MKIPHTAVLSLAILAGITQIASAASSVSGVIIDYVSVGNPGNAPDPATGSLHGAVAYEYKIAKYETTVGQYTEFLNAVAKSDPYQLYNSRMASDTTIAGISRNGSSGSYSYAPVAGSANKPITYVSWFDAARFCNWLHNGQGSGSTETGAYTLNGAMSGIYTVIPGAQTWIPSENEWYKAAYYDPNKGDEGVGGYRRYPTPGDAVPTAVNANFNSSGSTDVGSYISDPSSYGTFDQGGNVWEWNDAVVSDSSRGRRGGSWASFGALALTSPYTVSSAPSYEHAAVGFRVATVPEPSCLVLTLLATGMWVTRRNR